MNQSLLFLGETQELDEEGNKSLFTVKKKGGKKPFGKKGDKNFEKVLAEAQSYQKKYATADDIPDEELPESYDFRNIQGYDFTNIHVDQSVCGSCYTMGFVQAMNSRLKLKYGKHVQNLSPQHLLQCNFLNEGCNGGQPTFNALFAENAFLVSEKCAPYTHVTKGATCGQFAHCPPVAKVASTKIVGGGYAKVTEKQMMKELLRNGPTTTDF